MNTLLIGPRASGKTTIGRLLAQQCAREFVDLDDRVLTEFSLPSVQQVWSAHGESAWRAAESAVLSKLLEQDDLVIALGGGTPMIPQARQLIETQKARKSAQVVYLRCDLPQLVGRLRNDPGDRPSLTGGIPAEEMSAILQERHPVYERLATLVFECGTQSPNEIAHALAVKLANDTPRSKSSEKQG